jgi:hypothetical protein
MKTSNTLGLSILAGGLAFVGSANAVDLIQNGSFEIEGRVPSGSVLTGWSGFMGTYNHSGEAYYFGPGIPDSENPGAVYSWQHRAVAGVNGPAGVAQVTQTVDLTTAVTAADIDAGRGRYTFSAWLASYTDNPEQPYLTVQFFNGSSTQMGSTVIFDRTSANFWVRNADSTDLTPPSASNHMFSKYLQTAGIPSGARTATVGIGRSPNAGLGGSPDTYVDLVKLDVEAVVFVPPSVASAQPVGPNTRPDAIVSVALQDGTTQVNTNTIQLSFDGILVSPIIQKSGSATTITYDPPGLLPASSSHTVRLVFNDNGSPVLRQTNDFSFSVLRYYNILLPSPIYLENFESTAEGSLPAGWTQVSYSGVPDPVCNPLSPDVSGLQDLNSACYATWVVVDSTRFQSPMLTYSGHTPETDYQRVLSTNIVNVVNGAIVESVAQGKIAFGDSGYRDGGSQIVYLFSPDFDLTGRNNVYLSFHSLWEQNQDSIGAVEYSVDEGATWLPIVYMLDGPDILRDASGQIDAALTFSTPHGDVATYIDPADQQQKGGNYGAFIGVASSQWAGLGPYISARLNDDPVESKRVEVYRLPAADNQSKVRLRFAHAGTDSWYFGIDDVGLYSLSVVSAPLINGPTPTNYVEAVGNSATFTVDLTGIGPFTYQWQHNGTNLPGQTSATVGLTGLQLTSAGNYSVVIGYVGGSVTSSVASLVVFTAEPSRVIGQWDFNNSDLAATCGSDLDYFDNNVAFNTGFGDTDFFGVPRIGGQAVLVMNFPGATAGQPTGGYKMRHGLSGTGGGTNVNQYTLIMDILYPAAANNTFRALLQTDPSNLSENDFRINQDNAIGVTGNFHGTILPDTWYRVALAVDLAGPGPNPIVTKFINGVKVGQHALAEGRDGRWSLSANPDAPFALLFADNDVDEQAGYVSSVQLRAGRLSDASIAAMGGPQATKIPGAVCAQTSGSTITIRWSGSVLEGADQITGPWNPVPGAAKPYSVPTPLGSRKFYRSR